ncbi:MAG: hypothetical protein JW969_09850, partial [Spirochaetales bacterium]|nr:hypothetical protein [Spirochaetales bacterium]
RKDEYTKIAETDKKNLEQEMSKLVIEVMNLGNDLVEKKNYALDALAEDYERLQQEFAGKSRLFHDSIDEKMQLFSQNFEENLVKSETAQKKNLEKLEERYKTLTTGIAEIDKKQKNFVEQTKLFERADKLKDRLSNDIEEIKKDIIKLEPDKKKLSELEIEMNRVKKFSEDISTRFSKFLTDRRRIENMEKDFSRLIKYSEEIESKLKDMTGAHDQLQVIQIKLKEIENLENSIGTQYDRLEKKNAILDNTARGVDKGFQMLSDLENNIKTLSENFNELPPKVISMKEEIKFLLENKHKTDSAIEQLNSLEGVMTNLEERMLKMQTAREWLSRTETRLESIGKQASEQVKLLHSLVKEKVNEMNKKGAPPLDIRQTILQLASQGWKVHEIARATEVSQGEVELILELAPQTR